MAKRLIVSLIVYPLLSLLIPAGDVFNFFIAALIFTLLLLVSGRFTNGKDRENRPDWEGEDKRNKKEENGTVLFILKIRGNYEDKRK